MYQQPCASDPDLWFGYPDDDEGDGSAKGRAYEAAALEARTLCLRRCPLAQQRRCARYAVEHGEAYGVWAGVKLPGNQYRKRHELARAHELLTRIANGELTPRELPENLPLLRRRPITGPATLAVLHQPAHRSAA